MEDYSVGSKRCALSTSSATNLSPTLTHPPPVRFLEQSLLPLESTFEVDEGEINDSLEVLETEVTRIFHSSNFYEAREELLQATVSALSRMISGYINKKRDGMPKQGGKITMWSLKVLSMAYGIVPQFFIFCFYFHTGEWTRRSEWSF